MSAAIAERLGDQSTWLELPSPVPELLPRAAQQITTTPSRRCRPAVWLCVAAWLIAAGLHPKADAQTLRVARDLAGRMDYTEGTVLYRIEDTAKRLGISVATLKRHIKYLRELGALAWARHGSRANLHLPGRPYTATATIYAATVPPVYDQAMGHRLEGHGYHARVIGETRVATKGREHVVNTALTSGFREPQSLTPTTFVEKAEVSEKSKNTTRRRATRKARRFEKSPQARAQKSARASASAPAREPASRRSPLQFARDIRIARHVRPLVGWTQREGLRRLAHALRPLIDKGLDAHAIAAELTAMCWNWSGSWRPARPAAFITARLAADARHEARLREEEQARARSVPAQAHAEWMAVAGAFQEAFIPRQRARTDDGRRLARAYAVHDPARVIAHIEEHGIDDAIDLYGPRHTARAAALAASPHIQLT